MSTNQSFVREKEIRQLSVIIDWSFEYVNIVNFSEAVAAGNIVNVTKRVLCTLSIIVMA